MNEKTISLISDKDILSAGATLLSDDDCTDISIFGKLHISLNKNEVLKAALIYEGHKKENLGVININFGSMVLRKKLDASTCFPQGICITQKNTDTEEEICIAWGGFTEDFCMEDLSYIYTTKNPTPLSTARNLLEEIKNALETNDRGISKRNCINAVKRNLKDLPEEKHSFRMFDTFYRVETFCPVVNLSALKYLMIEGLCTYSFYEAGHYYLSLNNNLLLVAFREYNNHNPLHHLKDISFSFEINCHTYYGAIIELSDEGQYFVN